MERWQKRLGKHVPEDPRLTAFLDAIEFICKMHGLSISHEDDHGAFMIEEFNPGNIEWLRAAFDNRMPTA